VASGVHIFSTPQWETMGDEPSAALPQRPLKLEKVSGTFLAFFTVLAAKEAIREHEEGVRNLFSLSADACGENNEIVRTGKVPGTCSDLMPLLVQKPI
jgi:hypothetical protein